MNLDGGRLRANEISPALLTTDYHNVTLVGDKCTRSCFFPDILSAA